MADANERDHFMMEKNWERLEQAKVDIARRLRDLADDIDGISMTRHTGERRDPLDIAAEVDHTLKWGVINAPLSRMFSWAGAIYEARDYQNKKEV